MFKYTSSKKTIHLLVVIAMFVMAFIATQPAYADDPTPNPAAEQYLLESLQLYGFADLEFFSDSEADRVVDGFFLSEALKDPKVRSQPVLFISNTTISGPLYTNDLILPAGLVFINVQMGDVNFFNSQLQSFEIYNSTLGYLELSNTSINRNLVISGNTINGDVTANDATFKNNVNISENTTIGSLSVAQSSINGSADFRKNTISESINFHNTYITGEFLFDDSEINGSESQFDSTTFPVELGYLTVDGLASFSNTKLAGSANFANSTFGKLDASNATFKKSVSFEEALVNRSANFKGTTFSGKADFTGFKTDDNAKFENATFKADAIFINAHTVNYANFNGATFSGIANFTGFKTDDNAIFENATFKGDANFNNLHVGNFANFDQVAFQGEANFENATVVRAAEFNGTKFMGKAIFDYFTAERFLDFVNVTFAKGFSIYYASVAWPYFDGVTFNGPVNFEGLRASEDFEINNTSYNFFEKPFPMTFAIIEGAVKFSDFTSPAGMNLSNSEFRNLSISTKDNPRMAEINLSSTYILTDLKIEKVDMQNFLAESLYIEGSTSLKQVTISKKLDLRNAYIGFLKVDEKFKWPNDPTAFNLRGMVYTDIDLGNRGLTEDTWNGLLLLIEQSAYSPQAYDALSQFLTDKGHPDWAGDVKLANKVRERDEILTPLSGPWVWSWFLFIFAGYGYRPALAFLWSGLVVLFGAYVFRNKEHMLPVEQNDIHLVYNPFWYSFSLFLPYIDLNIATKWAPNPERTWLRNYKYIHMILGWILAPIALLAFSGILG